MLYKVPFNRAINVYFESESSLQDIQNAYKESCKSLGLQLHEIHLYSPEKNYIDESTTKKFTDDLEEWREIVVSKRTVSEKTLQVLEEHGFDVNSLKGERGGKRNGVYFLEEDLISLFFFFVKYSLPDFQYKPFPQEAVNIIDSNLNIQLGAGL